MDRRISDRQVSVLRGISGSGKTFWARRFARGASVFSTDAFFMVGDEYRFDPARLREYHRRCFRGFLEALADATPWVVVDNTNVEAWEYSPYILAAEALGYDVELLTFRCSVEVSLARKRIVPEARLRSMHERFERETREMPARFQGLHRFIEAA